MSRWIDADALKTRKKLDGDTCRYYIKMDDVYSAPSIDIVRCKECKWRGEQTESGIPYYWCRLVGVGYEVPIEHYCSYGEREGE